MVESFKQKKRYLLPTSVVLVSLIQFLFDRYVDVSHSLEAGHQQTLVLWQKLHADLRSLLSWQYLMKDIHLIRSWNISMVCSLLYSCHLVTY